MGLDDKGEVQLADRLLPPLETLANVHHLLRERLTGDADLFSLLTLGERALTEMVLAVQGSLDE